jgi:rhamnogalacturonan acetylesterase
MKLSLLSTYLLTLNSVVLASQSQVSPSTKIPTIWVAGDSTTAPDGGHNGTEGWAQYLKYSFANRAFVNNSAYAGRSARSVRESLGSHGIKCWAYINQVQFTREGRFERIAQALQPGDWVVIEFGINDGGAPQNGSSSTTGDKGRADCPGAGNETCTVVFK